MPFSFYIDEVLLPAIRIQATWDEIRLPLKMQSLQSFCSPGTYLPCKVVSMLPDSHAKSVLANREQRNAALLGKRDEQRLCQQQMLYMDETS